VDECELSLFRAPVQPPLPRLDGQRDGDEIQPMRKIEFLDQEAGDKQCQHHSHPYFDSGFSGVGFGRATVRLHKAEAPTA
jgi:hypothetical protein